MKKILGVVLAAIIIVMPGWAKAADADLPVPIQEYKNIRYYSMGVSTEERRTLPQLYPLKLIFATDQGHMLCDADVTVSAGGKTVFRGRSENGPWLIIDLPPGGYDIEAVLDGKTRTAKGVVITAGKKRTINLRWKTTEVRMGLKDNPEK
ncbi:MAG: hypothetical protein FD159_1843 [Syntrophaceae bacterium]|nr:MAG: hypothetical protein FD159_1843 [Syntrophaceae bacterium]